MVDEANSNCLIELESKQHPVYDIHRINEFLIVEIVGYPDRVKDEVTDVDARVCNYHWSLHVPFVVYEVVQGRGVQDIVVSILDLPQEVQGVI